MKRFLTVLAMMALTTGVLAAEDGATIFKKCAMCHGADGHGKIGPSIAGKDVTDVLTKGGKSKAPHTGRFAGLTDEQITAVAAHVKTLK